MSLAMVVIASMIGVKGLGLPVLRAISNQYLALGLLNGLAIVTLAIIFDPIAPWIATSNCCLGINVKTNNNGTRKTP